MGPNCSTREEGWLQKNFHKWKGQGAIDKDSGGLDSSSSSTTKLQDDIVQVTSSHHPAICIHPFQIGWARNL